MSVRPAILAWAFSLFVYILLPADLGRSCINTFHLNTILISFVDSTTPGIIVGICRCLTSRSDDCFIFLMYKEVINGLNPEVY